MPSTLILALLLALPVAAQITGGPAAGVVARWQTPTGAVIEVAPCDSGICATLVALDPNPPTRVDQHNPSPALRSRSLCGLRIGTGFHLSDTTHAIGGQLYDPKSGKIYSGSMSSEGDTLHLRGYVGIPLFGRTETWIRLPPNKAFPTCQ